jgi:chemotaxis protein methyltransferase CheR
VRRLGGNFSRLLDELVRERVGLASSRRHELAKERVLDAAMRRVGVTDEAMYLELLKRDHKEFDALISDLTVPETYFFRDPPHYAMLRREVLPALTRSRGRDHVVEAWSAGCATGEEPYSLAMMFEQEHLASRSHVLGTDVSQRALARASAAIYTRWSMRATATEDRERYFVCEGREFRLISRIRERVRFQQHSLTSPLYPKPRSRAQGFDLILCRNVLIYFDPAAIVTTTQRLASSLSEDGFLLMGPSDPLLELEEWCDTITTPCGLLYRRRSAEQSRQARPARAWTYTPPLARQDEGPERASITSARPAADAPVTPVEGCPRESAQATAGATSTGDEVELVRGLVHDHGPAAAEAACRDLLRAEPLSGPLHLLHATLLVDLERTADAELALRRALYLDRNLLIAQMLNATLLERGGAHGEALRCYAQLASQARAQAATAPVLLGDGLTHGALADLAEQRVRALKSRGKT